MNKSVSVIIPAANEEAYIKEAVDSVRSQGVEAKVIVAVNNSTDLTYEMAKEFADTVIACHDKCKVGEARNIGAREAKSDILIFLDADSRLGENVLKELLSRDLEDTYGTVFGRPDNEKFRYRLFFFLKNIWHRLGLYKGVLGGMMFCDRELFERMGGFDPDLFIDEFYDFSGRARRAGGRYKLVPSCYSVTSMRRFESRGLIRMLFYWTKLRFFTPIDFKKMFKKGYFNIPGGW
jgi:glycosyltransferase involved in cell wall biosynthesis